ncbi:hyaluronidase-1 [Anolis carolinensis]|uniref:hyaluronidase-1 n=1 Tax=Anolis carolinensis TaxID=28377 RepID=UPI0004627CF6|nr:PREDICTED: hyaluronidase-1 [Anolis carolinensis]|eukprot:XP_008109468.1 PREDICTED: hyaluronidase-1 [Anolis carolinensis]
MYHLWIKWLPLWLLLMVADESTAMSTKAPLFPNKAFVVVWNAPTEQCRLRYKVDLDLNIFDVLSNPNDTLNGPTVTIFYPSQLGYYPHFANHRDSIEGGIPQNQSIIKHLNKAKLDINRFIKIKTFQGLGVIDWEDWRPQWDRNWGKKNIYRDTSLELVKKSHPEWSKNSIQKIAKEEFENAGKNFMTSTLTLAEDMRPNGLWGYYLYPDCYNYDYKTKNKTYTGKCPDLEYSRNDLLLWLWKESTALFPSIYLENMLKSSTNALKFVHYRVKEAMRIASIARKDYALPVFIYARPFYAYTFEPLSEIDLVHTIGESAAMGAAGVILWGSMQYASTHENCLTVKKYIDGLFGHYIVNVTTATKICSKILCKRNGRCIRKDSESFDYLHLHPRSFKIRYSETMKKVYVVGRMKRIDKEAMKEKFMCQCYQNWTGKHCKMPSFKMRV